MKKAWIENGVIRDVCSGNPVQLYHPDIAALYDTDVPDNAENGDSFVDNVLTKPQVNDPPPPAVEQIPAIVSAIEFKLLFTAPERVAIKNSIDPIVQDFYDLVQDQRLTEVNLALPSVAEALQYLEGANLIAAGRAAEILSGKLQ